MNTDSKIAIGISSALIAIGVFLFIWILPFLFIWLSFGVNLSNVESLPYIKKAVKYSMFRTQKLYTLERIITTLIVLEKDKEAISYYEIYEKLNPNNEAFTKTLVTYAYIRTKNYDKALEISKETNNLYQQAKIYVEINDLDKAKETVEKIFSTKTKSKRPYLYVAQIQLKEGHLKSAHNSIDKLLKVKPTHIDALKTKAKIFEAQGNKTQAEIYYLKAKQIKDERNKKLGIEY